MLARTLLLVCAVILTASCGADEPAIETGPGGCISLDGKAVDYVDCQTPKANRVLVVQIAEGYPCPSGLSDVTIETTIDGKPRGVPQRWCVVSPSKLTPEHQRLIDREKADEVKNNP